MPAQREVDAQYLRQMGIPAIIEHAVLAVLKERPHTSEGVVNSLCAAIQSHPHVSPVMASLPVSPPSRQPSIPDGPFRCAASRALQSADMLENQRPSHSLRSAPHLHWSDVYQAGTFLGEGAYGRVMEVIHINTGVKYAAKFVNVTKETAPEVREVVSTSKKPIRVGSRVQGIEYADIVRPEKPTPYSGVVCYLGRGPLPLDGHDDEDEDWAGVELDVEVGTHNGTVDGVQYFSTAPNRGAFIKIDKLWRVKPHVVELMDQLNHAYLLHLVDWRGGRHAYLPSKPKELIVDWKHPVYEEDNDLIMILELAQGGDLDFNMKSLDIMKVSEQTIAKVMYSVFSGVAFLHSKHIIHHDIKPGNVLMKRPLPSDPGEREDIGDLDDLLATQVKLCDMGMTKRTSDPTPSGGTLMYMAPELMVAQVRWQLVDDSPLSLSCWTDQFQEIASQVSNITIDSPRDKPLYDTKVDCFSLGVMLYHLFTENEHPFPIAPYYEKGTAMVMQVCQSIIDGPSFSEFQWDLVSEEAKDLIRGLLRAHPRDRLSCREALAHKWFEVQLSKAERSVDLRSIRPKEAPKKDAGDQEDRLKGRMKKALWAIRLGAMASASFRHAVKKKSDPAPMSSTGLEKQKMGKVQQTLSNPISLN